jgi:hypothetical protein
MAYKTKGRCKQPLQRLLVVVIIVYVETNHLQDIVNDYFWLQTMFFMHL